MASSRLTWKSIGTESTLFAASAGLGAGVSAAIRGGNVKESASVTALGSVLLLASTGAAIKFGLFGEASKGKPEEEPTTHFIGPAILELIGTSVGYVGLKLFFNAALSKKPFIDASLGSPITAGVFFCSKFLLDYYEHTQTVQKENLKSHTL